MRIYVIYFYRRNGCFTVLVYMSGIILICLRSTNAKNTTVYNFFVFVMFMYLKLSQTCVEFWLVSIMFIFRRILFKMLEMFLAILPNSRLPLWMDYYALNSNRGVINAGYFGGYFLHMQCPNHMICLEPGSNKLQVLNLRAQHDYL